MGVGGGVIRAGSRCPRSPTRRLRVVRQTLVDPVHLVGVLVVLEQVLVLVREGALVVPRLGQAVDAVACAVRLRGAGRVRRVRRIVRRVGAGAVEPVERVDRHHVAVDELVEVPREESRDVGLALGVDGLVEVRVPHVVDKHDNVVGLVGRDLVVVGRQVQQLG